MPWHKHALVGTTVLCNTSDKLISSSRACYLTHLQKQTPKRLDPLIFIQLICRIMSPHLRACVLGSVHTTPTMTGADQRMVEMLKKRADAAPFPPGGVTYRGGGFPAEHKQFFRLGRKFRAPCFLATSFSWDRAEQFRSLAQEQGFDTILWRVEVTPHCRFCLAYTISIHFVDGVLGARVPSHPQFNTAPTL